MTSVRLLCGKFGQELGAQPSDEQVRQAMFVQPNQGQFDAWLVPAPAAQVYEEPAMVGQPVYEEPVYEEPAPSATGGCGPNYSGCVPIVPYDLDCADIDFSVVIIGSDPHGFDGNDNDGLGCESY